LARIEALSGTLIAEFFGSGALRTYVNSSGEEARMSEHANRSDAVASAPPKRTNWMRALVAAVVLVVIAACIAWKGGVVPSKSRIAIITSTEDVYWDRLFEGGQSAARYFDADITTVRCPTDEALQSQKIRDLVAQGVGGIIVSPVKPEAQMALFNEVSSKIPLITVDSDSPKANRIAFIGTNNYEAGRQVGELLKAALPDGGLVMICVGSVESDNGKSRRDGLLDALNDRARDDSRASESVDQKVQAGKYTLQTLVDGADLAKARSLATTALGSSADLKAFVGLWSYNTPAVLDALKESGKLGKIKVVGFDDLEPTLQGVESGNVFATLVQDQYNMGFDSVMIMCATLQHSNAVDSRPRKASLTCTALMSADDVKLFRMDREKTPATPQQ
jgi:ribose transport system substrate-binding protein